MPSQTSGTYMHALPASVGTAIWIGLIAGASILFSLAFACATPFAALATIAGGKMSRRDGLLLVLLAWLANQAIGYLILHYPQTPESFGWGAAIGIAALLASLAANESAHWLAGGVKVGAISFLCAFIVYEACLYAATALLPSSEEAFSFHVVLRILEINGLAFLGLLVVHRIATVTGLLMPRAAEPILAHRA